MYPTEQSIHILHVDDDPTFAEALATFVEHRDNQFVIETETSASEGLDRLAESNFECVVSDYDMPGQNGIEFLKTVRNNHPDLPFILLTGKGSEQVASEAISAGVTDYLQKGGEEKYKLLVNRIERAVAESRLQEFWRALKQDPLLLIERLSDPVYSLNEDWEFTYLNQTAEERFGTNREELLNSNIWEQFSEATDTSFYEQYLEAVAEGEPRIIEEQFGPWNAWYREYLYPSESGLTVISQEITDEKQRELELDRNRELLKHVEELTRVGGWEADAETERQFWTDGTYHIHDLDPAGELEPTIQDGLDFYHPDDRETIRQAIKRCLSDGVPYDEELRLVTAEGRTRWVRTYGQPVRESGEIVAVRGAIQDITEQKEREQELTTTKRRLDLALQRARAGIWEWDFETDDLYWSDELLELLELSPETFDGSIDEFNTRLHPDDRAQVEEAIEEAIETGEPYRVEERIETAGGDYRWLDVRGQVTGDRTGLVGVAFDITERKHREQQLKRQNERLDAFADMVSHDLRNPMNVAQIQLELLEDECDSDHLERIDSALTRMADLIKNLLTLAREGEQATETKPVEVSKAVERCWHNVTTADATLRTEIDGQIQADRSRLQEFLENLIRNAVEHGGDDVTVTVGELENGFFVEDDGPGIDPENRTDVFGVGYSTGHEGTGIGLSIVKQIAESHEWEIRVVDGSDGGTRFEITDVAVTE